jgi:DNA topoisomerase-2
LLSKLARTAYREEDAAVLNYLDDDGVIVEPEYYIPVVPMILINGGLGIGTGFSTNVPCHNPQDIIDHCKAIARTLLTKIGPIEDDNHLVEAEKCIMDMDLVEVKPWYLGFKGDIIKHKEGTYMSKGCYKWVNDTTIEITELPIGTWTDDYKDHLIAMCSNGNKYIKDFESYYTAKNVNFKIKVAPGIRSELEPILESEFKLCSTKNLSLNNIHLFSAQGSIQKYKDTIEVLKNWATVRLQKYVERKRFMIGQMEKEHTFLSAKVRFIQNVIDGNIVMSNKKLSDVESELHNAGYPVNRDCSNIADDDNGVEGGYAYLTRMPMYNMTLEKKAALEQDANNLASKIHALAQKSVQQIWLDELEEFEAAWIMHKEEVENEYSEDANGKPATAKMVRKRAPTVKK